MTIWKAEWHMSRSLGKGWGSVQIQDNDIAQAESSVALALGPINLQ